MPRPRRSVRSRLSTHMHPSMHLPVSHSHHFRLPPRSSFQSSLRAAASTMLRTVDKHWGMLLFSLLVCLYFTNFCNISATHTARSHTIRTHPVHDHLLHASRATLQQLPGHASSQAPVQAPTVMTNSLPGALHSESSFDAHQNQIHIPKEKPPSSDTKRVAVNKLQISNSPQPSPAKQSPKSETDKDVPESKDSGQSESESSHSEYSHPMNRNVQDIQVPAATGPLEAKQVREYYEKLVKTYLYPFRDGIETSSFFNILKRKTYGLTPPGANKGAQTILFQMIAGRVHLLDPYQVTKNSKPFYRSRLKELIWFLSQVAKDKTLPNSQFLVAIHDCVQTVSKSHSYRGATYKESNPVFTIVACNFSDNIPIPMWEGDAVRGGLRNWDKKMAEYRAADKTAWEDKKSRAVFRGGNRPSMFFNNKKDADRKCNSVGRTRLLYIAKKNAEMFDVGISGRCGKKTYTLSRLSEVQHHLYKYILYAEGNCFWADRLNKQVFGPSVIVKQETPCGQFWEPLLKPMTHYIPTDFFFRDTVERIEWAKEHDEEAKQIVQNANEFAANFLSLKGIKLYMKVLLVEYSKLLNAKEIKVESGSVDVTVD